MLPNLVELLLKLFLRFEVEAGGIPPPTTIPLCLFAGIVVPNFDGPFDGFEL